MKQLLILLVICLIPFETIGQGTKGSKAQLANDGLTGTVRAVIVGISDYQFIDDLKYADRDARVFYNYLTSEAGGSVDTANIKLLLNETANLGNVILAFSWLEQASQPNDRAIVYFSGHGDVETMTDAKRGYLLTYNTPKNVYAAGGMDVSVVQDFLNTMTSNDIDVVLYADACRSGKLAGRMEGATLTNEALRQKVEKQVKVLSCQPGELSVESEDWGGGRGVFSYHLVRGLIGIADSDENGEITLWELYSHLMNTVKPEAKPMTQVPVAEGDMESKMAIVHDASLARIIEHGDDDDFLLASLDVRSIGMMDDVSDDLEAQIMKFEQYLMEGNLYDADASCAWQIFHEIPKNEVPENLYNAMQRNLAATLQNSAQEVINDYITGELIAMKSSIDGNYLFSSPVMEQRKFFEKAAVEMKLTRDLLGHDHILNSSLYARQLFLEGRSIAGSNDLSEVDRGIGKLDESIQLDPYAAYSYNALGILKNSIKKYDAAITDFKKAIEMAPTWANPVANLGVSLTEKGQYDVGRVYLNRALDLDPGYFYIYNDLGMGFAREGNLDSAAYFFERALELDPMNSMTYNNLGAVKYSKGDLETAATYYQEGIELDPLNPKAHKNFGLVQSKTGDKKGALESFLTAVNIDPQYAAAYFEIGNIFKHLEEPDTAIHYYNKCLELSELFWPALVNLGNLHLDKQNYEAAIKTYLVVAENSADKYPNIYCLLYDAHRLSGNQSETKQWRKKAIKSECMDKPERTPKSKPDFSRRKGVGNTGRF